jgi:hypothetical protein
MRYYAMRGSGEDKDDPGLLMKGMKGEAGLDLSGGRTVDLNEVEMGLVG